MRVFFKKNRLLPFCAMHIINNLYFWKCLWIGQNLIQLVYFKYHKGTWLQNYPKRTQLTLRAIYNIISWAEKDNYIKLKHTEGRPSKLNRCNQQKIFKKITSESNHWILSDRKTIVSAISAKNTTLKSLQSYRK